jgi:hypothetical protein
MHKTPQEIEGSVPATYAMSAFFGFISGLANDDFVRYAVLHREHPIVRHVFFSDIQKRADLPPEVVDEVVAALLMAVEEGKDRAKNETLIRYFIPHLSKQMRTRTFRTIMRVGTKTTRAKLLRKLTPGDAPGIEAEVFDIAISESDEHALVGIVYRWPAESWALRSEELFKAAEDLPWLQRQIIFRSGKADTFLDNNLIVDPVTELYVRARYGRDAADELIEKTIDTAKFEQQDVYSMNDRLGLVVWCLGRLSKFEQLERTKQEREFASVRVDCWLLHALGKQPLVNRI